MYVNIYILYIYHIYTYVFHIQRINTTSYIQTAVWSHVFYTVQYQQKLQTSSRTLFHILDNMSLETPQTFQTGLFKKNIYFTRKLTFNFNGFNYICKQPLPQLQWNCEWLWHIATQWMTCFYHDAVIVDINVGWIVYYYMEKLSSRSDIKKKKSDKNTGWICGAAAWF